MKNLKPYKILWWTIPVIFFPIAFGQDSAFDLQLHDTYFVFASIHIAALFAMILGLLGWIYWLLKSFRLNPLLTTIHSIGTSLTLIGIAILSILQTIYRATNFEIFRTLNSIGASLLVIFIVIQFIFLFNLIIGIIKGKE